MIAGGIRYHPSGEGTRFEASVRSSSTVRPEALVWFDFGGEMRAPIAGGDPWLAALLLPAMFSGEPLEIQAPVSERLLRTSREFQKAFSCWYPHLLQEVKVTTGPAVPTEAHNESGPAAAFFSGGADSWFTLVDRGPQLCALITVQGFDIPVSDADTWAEVKQTHEIVSRETGKELVTVRTNLREVLDPEAGCFKRACRTDFWGECFHGPCLAAVGLFLQERFSSLYIASSWQYRRLQPWGSHPATDALWSTGTLEFIHHGAELSRFEKIRRISGSELALSHLRVCTAGGPGVYNCGACEKCLRTMASLRLCDALDRCTVFARPFNLRAWELEWLGSDYRSVYREMIEFAEAKPDPELARTMKIVIGEVSSWRRGWHRWRARMKRSVRKRLALLPGWHSPRQIARPV